MIGSLTGKLQGRSENTVVVDVNGVGYEVLVPQALAASSQHEQIIALNIHTHVTESSLQLYGFGSLKEKRLFQKLISVSGIGPKVALNVLSQLSVNDLLKAIVTGNVAALTAINGVGKKTAERLVMELKDKFKEEIFAVEKIAANDDRPEDNLLKDVENALITLGYSDMVARKVVTGLDISAQDSVQALIKKSLHALKTP